MYLINFFCYFYLLEVKLGRNFVLEILIIGFLVMNNNYGDYYFYYVMDGFFLNGYIKMFYLDFELFLWINVDLLDIFIIFFVCFYNRVDGFGNFFILFDCIFF